MARRPTRPPATPSPAGRPSTPPAPFEQEDRFGPWLGERLRRVALGLTGALLTARAYWPSESPTEADTGNGLLWILAILLAAGLAVAAPMVGGLTRFRWSWADAAVYSLILLVGLSSTRGADRRPAINLAWEWAGLGIAYALVRNLPRTRGESTALAGALTASAVAVSAYGLIQVGIEFPVMHADYLRDPIAVLRKVGISPDSPAKKSFEDRLLGSNEPYATFGGLANSLAGYLVGPTVLALAVVLENLRSRRARGSLLVSLASAMLPGLVLLGCLLMTKSRSAYLGLAVAIVVLGWRQRGRLPARALALAGLGLVGIMAVLVAIGVATRHLDLLVLTESNKSLRYRAEYWEGTIRVIRGEPGVFWRGLGPGNFFGPYLRHKLPQASEEIRDPHNLFLEVWSTAGIWACLALLVALLAAFRDLFGPSRQADPPDNGPDASSAVPAHDPSAPPGRSAWLLASAGGGWLVATVVGQLDPFQEDLLPRWLSLGCAWALAVLLGLPLWRRLPIPAAGLGAAALAVVINLLGAGGIGVPTVALALWSWIALGLNLRDDRPCGRLRIAGGRAPAFLAALVWAALVGSFSGSIVPYWRAEAAMREAEAALRVRPPQFAQARDAYVRAAQLDKLAVRPWLELADLEYRYWVATGFEGNGEFRKLITYTLDQAMSPPRNPASLEIQKRRSAIAREILARRGTQLPVTEVVRLQAQVVEATRRATQLYPTNALLHAELAEASAALGDVGAAKVEAKEALRLDQITPHPDKKLPDPLRQRLEERFAPPPNREPPG